MVEYHQKHSNSSCFISLAFALTASGENNAENATVIRIEESLNCQYKGYSDGIVFDNAIMSD